MTPRATARLQFNRAFTLDDAVAVVPYLADLGVSHIYASPIFAARPGSSHGYDIVDPTAISAELGGMAALERLAAALKARSMGLIVDIVPNHMAASHENRWWFDVLEWGTRSRFARFFDINWLPQDPELRNKVLLPVLGDSLSAVIERGEIELTYDPARQRLVFKYYDRLLPVAAESYLPVFERLGGPFPSLATGHPENGPQAAHPLSTTVFDEICARLASLHATRPAEVDATLERFNKTGRHEISMLLEQQHYALAHWTAAATRINWRRFFDISDLIALRMERSEVYRATHSLVRELVKNGLIDGVRIDHIDGLADPRAYCRRLHRDLSFSGGKGNGTLAPYMVVEKILAVGEQLRSDWRMDGTTGYDFMAQVSAVLHRPAGEAVLTGLWKRIAPMAADFATVVRAARAETLTTLFPRALADLAELFLTVSGQKATTAAREQITQGLELLLIAFARYRLYGDANGLPLEDMNELDACRHRAVINQGEREREAVEAICNLMRKANDKDRRTLVALQRFQQLSATLTAKAIEDTAFYRYRRLLSRNEVGSDPAQFSITVDQFHASNQRRQRAFPHAMLATATHDHKRGEDVRCRLAVISEDAELWSDLVESWLARHETTYATISPSDKLMIYQTIIGAWPLELTPTDREGLASYRSRLARWLSKSLREAKESTSWMAPNGVYEEACARFLRKLLDPSQDTTFLTEAHAYLCRIGATAALNGLVQLTLKLTCPGIPDLYQGCDLWDFSLVDPDNRSLVDYDKRRTFLAQSGTLLALLSRWQDGRIKQKLLQLLLQLRQEKAALFADGLYLPLAVSGPRASQLIAFVRQDRSASLIVIVPRLVFADLQGKADLALDADDWGGTAVHLPQRLRMGSFQNAVSGENLTPDEGVIPLGKALEPFPICLLVQTATNEGLERQDGR